MSCSPVVSVGPTVQAFLDAELKLIEVIGEGGPSLNASLAGFFHLIAHTKEAMSQNLLSDTEKRRIHAISSNIRTIAACFHEVERSVDFAEKRSLSECAAVLEDSSNQRTGDPSGSSHQAKKKSQTVKDSTLTEATRFKPCCDYFLAHFGSPYPPSDVKYALAAEIGVEISSITMWFTNNRRRSGWNTVMRDYANNNKELMRQLVDDVLNPSEARSVPEDAKKAVLGAKTFITRLCGDEISEVFREALAMEPMTPEELKTYREERRMLQKCLADLKRTQEEREAHKTRKSARAKAREQAARRVACAAANTSIAAPGLTKKRRRTDENEVVEIDNRQVKKKNTGADGVLDASAVAPTSAHSKRKRIESGAAGADIVTPDGERFTKRARTSHAPLERKPRLRYVLDADGNPRRLRRKAQFRYRPAPPTKETQNTETNIQADIQQPMTPLVVKKRKHYLDPDCTTSFSNAPPPKLPTNHKRRRTAPQPSSRSVSSPQKPQPPRPRSKPCKNRSHGRSASAPTASGREVPFLIPNVNNAMRESNRTASGPSALVGLGAYIEGDAMLPPLTEEQLAMFVTPNADDSNTSDSAASGLAANVDQITIDLDPNTFDTMSLPFCLNSFNLSPTPLSNSSSLPTHPDGEGIDAFLQMMIPQHQLEAPMTGNLFLDPSQLNAQLSQLEAEQAAQQQSLNALFISPPQSGPFLPSPTPVTNAAAPQVPGSFEDVLMNVLIAPPQPLPQRVLAPSATTFRAAASNSLSASSSFSSDFSGTSSFDMPSPAEEHAETKSLSDSRGRSVSPSRVSSIDLYAELERRKRDLEDHLREYERKKAEFGSIVTACAHSVIESSDLIDGLAC